MIYEKLAGGWESCPSAIRRRKLDQLDQLAGLRLSAGDGPPLGNREGAARVAGVLECHVAALDETYVPGEPPSAGCGAQCGAAAGGAGRSSP